MRLLSITLICSASFFMATTFKDLIPDGTKFDRQSARYSLTIFWKACKKTRIRESDQLETVLV